jgi:hypothetical protein
MAPATPSHCVRVTINPGDLYMTSSSSPDVMVSYHVLPNASSGLSAASAAAVK